MRPGGPVIQVAGYGKGIKVQHIGHPHQPGIKVLTHNPHGALHRSIGYGVIADRSQAQLYLPDLAQSILLILSIGMPPFSQ
jgi:hypothetical protein